MKGDLTPREMEVLMAVAQYEKAVEAAYELGISRQSVKNHLYAAYQKLGVNNAIAAFRELGWLQVP